MNIMPVIDTSKNPASVEVLWDSLRDWYDAIISLLLMNLLFLACWMTIILGPPATFGLYYVTNELVHGRSEGVRTMLKAMRRFFLKSWLWFMLNLIVVVALTVNIVFYWQRGAVWSVAVGALFLLLLILWVMVQFFALAYIMEQEEKLLRMALRNSLYTILVAPGYTLIVAGVTLLVLTIATILVFPLFAALPALAMIVANRAVIERLETYGVRERDALRQ